MRHVGGMSDQLATVAALDVRVEAYEWAFALEEAARVDAHWDALRAQRPALFDGRVLLSHGLAIEPAGGGLLRGRCFETGYRSFIAWRDFGHPGAPVVNCFALPALRAACGAFMLGAMSATTANAGRLYFPAGTPEPADADADGRVDFDANILRELEEETGLGADDVTLDPTWRVVHAGPLVALAKLARSPLDADALQARFAAYRATQAEPELDRLVPVRDARDFDAARMPAFMLRYLADALGT